MARLLNPEFQLQTKEINTNFSFILFFRCCDVKEKWKFCCRLFQGVDKKHFLRGNFGFGMKNKHFPALQTYFGFVFFQEGAFS